VQCDTCFGRNLFTSGMPSAQRSLATSLFPLVIRNQSFSVWQSANGRTNDGLWCAFRRFCEIETCRFFGAFQLLQTPAEAKQIVLTLSYNTASQPQADNSPLQTVHTGFARGR
jgi:hypothetical protein